jgi:tRNA/tmRNA/rRNA uracil-C5-methylase (TrmA/RlmC/RlmD family)
LDLDRAAELEAKRRIVEEAFGAHDIRLQIPRLIAGPSRVGYRNRVRMAVLNGRADFFNQSKRSGCPVLQADLWEGVKQLRFISAKYPAILASIEHLEVRVGDLPAQWGLHLAAPVDVEQLLNLLGEGWVVDFPGSNYQPYLTYHLSDGQLLNVPLRSFVQINSEVNRLLVSYVTNFVSGHGLLDFADLFCGAGNFVIPLLAIGLSGQAIDVNAEAVDFLVSQIAGSALTARSGDLFVLLTDDDFLSKITSADVVIVDPPRAGIKHGHSNVATLAKQFLICVGCYPVRLANDVAQLLDCGFVIESVQAFDMFPGTRHVETVAILRRASV